MPRSYKIVIASDGGTERDYLSGLSEAEAIYVCEANGWSFYDENDFAWQMRIEED